MMSVLGAAGATALGGQLVYLGVRIAAIRAR